ncbi:MAG TPA: bifunctional ADP-dependent NAD(P)H-hydrate dehydratase/NAD(P)H-hydrate epimerase, partial [Holosporales bacterium]|nr:bifunctional ADP-dependent NAD(P)H-hydrate dehydratase/NAD(P)H-hydrate epimerase [Holosporales bacterium]
MSFEASTMKYPPPFFFDTLESMIDQKNPILTAAQTKEWEKLTVQQGFETFESLMEKAGTAVTQEIIQAFPKGKVLVLCGPGNNGGDGYVIARKLKEASFDVTIAVDLSTSPKLSAEAQLNKDKWTGPLIPLDQGDFNASALIVDALFGTGLERPLSGLYLETVQKISAAKAPCVAVDIPSGLNADTGEIMGSAASAHLTVTFGSLKRGHVLLPGENYCGEIKVADIGFSDHSALKEPFPYENTPVLWRNSLPAPKPTDHKYTRGHLMVIAGKDMTGAPRLAAEASRRIGAGMTTLLCPESVKDLYQVSTLGTLVKSYTTLKDFTETITQKTVHGLLIGPGLLPSDDTRALVEIALKTKKKIVLDAGALSCFQDHKARLMDLLHNTCVLLPHDGEFQRLFEHCGTKIETTLKAAKDSQATLLLKGADTVIAAPDGTCYINTNAPATLATAGTGDVLAGLVGGLIVQGNAPLVSTAAATWIHAESAHLFGRGLI